MDTKSTLLTLLASPAEPRWTISAIARAAGVPWYAVRRYVREPNAGLSTAYQTAIDEFARDLSELKATKRNDRLD
jgi:hypothetical protein